MPRRYTLVSAATYIPLSPNEIVVKGSALEGFSLLVEDPDKRGIAASVIAVLERGARTPVELAGELAADVSDEGCADLLESMRRGGALTCVDDEAGDVDAEAAWSAFVRYGELPRPELLRTVTVAASRPAGPVLACAQSWGVPLKVVDAEALDLTAFAQPAAADGETESEEIPVRRDARPLVHLSFDSERAEVYRVNERAVAAGASVLYVRLDGVEYVVGPYVVPGRTACAWEAERSWARASADRGQYEMLLRHRSEDGAEAAPLSVGEAGLSAALAPSLLELSLRGTSERAGSAVHGRTTTQQTSTHSVMRLPRCPVCMPMQPLTRNPLY